ncbi:MAG: DUF1460 domain-containing protein [Mediterranea massiliensis]|nr:DUF1460 domain-containing protein [Mediterranea massiliensis]
MKKLFCITLLLYYTSALWAQTNEMRMVNHAIDFLDVPYVAHTLEVNDTEQLVINCDEVDCTTLVEYVMAMSLTPIIDNDISETDFADKLMCIRYRNGKIDGYTSRLHYITEWVKNSIKMGFLEDITAIHSSFTMKVNLNYMTTHPHLYKHLANSPENVAKMKAIEKELSDTEFHYIPKEELPHTGRSWIKSGDIICLTTNIPGLDVSHLGIAFYADGKLSLLHASYKDKKVMISKVSLSQMMASSENWTGIRVLRVKAQ